MEKQLAEVKAVFDQALEINVPAERTAYLDRACADAPDLRRRVEALLRAYEDAGSFMQEPAIFGAGSVNEVLTEAPGTVIGPYKLLERIGEGGFGVVFMAEQQQPVRRKVALKVLKPGMDTKQVVARFEAERQALALMDHPHIAHVLDAGATDTGRPYFVMELIRGIPSTAFCDDNRLTPRERLELFVAVCQAVQHAHHKGIIHRDLKPSNVLVTLLDGTPVPKVIDFGIAKALRQERLTDKTLCTGFAQMIGTPLYMSPEQAEMSGQDVDTRTDIYALGVLLYELLTGTTPFDKERLKEASYDEIRRIIREEEPAKPSTRISTLGQAATTVSANRKSEPRRLTQLFRGELDWIVMKALEKDRNRRYDTVSSFAADVQRYLDDEPVQACPPSAGYRLRKFAHKYRIPVTVAAAFALLLVVGVLVSAWQALRATQAEGEATRKRQEAEAAQERALTAEALARRGEYMANIRLMQPAWESHNMSQLHKLLDQTAAFPERGFEWYHWRRVCHVEHLILVGHKGGVTSVAFAPDGQRLVTGSTDGTAQIWDAASGQALWTLQGPNTGPVWAVAASPDGERVVTGSEDGTARVWEAASGQERLTLKGHTTLPVLGASTVGLLSLQQGQAPFLAASALYPGRTGHTGPVSAVAATPDGRQLVTGSEDGTARVWDARSGREILTLKGHANGVRSVAVTPDGRIITGGEEGTVKLWDAASGRELPSPLGHTGAIMSATLTPDGKRLITGSRHGVVKVWDLASGEEILDLMGHTNITCVAVSPDGHRLATASLDGTARVWDMASGRGTRTLPAQTSPVLSIVVTANGQRIVAGGKDGTVRIWDALDGKQLQKLEGHTGEVTCVAVTLDGQRIITGSRDRTVRIWDALDGKQLQKLEGHTGALQSVAVTPDGKRIVTGTEWDGEAKVWDAASGQVLFTHKDPNGILVTPDGKWIVMGRWDGTARIWDAVSDRELLTLRGHTRDVSSLAVIPDSHRLVTGSIDGTAAVWDVTNGRRLLSLKGHAASLYHTS